jgi:hypothetical protein
VQIHITIWKYNMMNGRSIYTNVGGGDDERMVVMDFKIQASSYSCVVVVIDLKC